tara:strand:- start:80 stop:385 length:306 start_codon:yes stop_codon:yes gene_type:complete
MLFLIFSSISGGVATITIGNFKDAIISLFVILDLILSGHLPILFLPSSIILIILELILLILKKIKRLCPHPKKNIFLLKDSNFLFIKSIFFLKLFLNFKKI